MCYGVSVRRTRLEAWVGQDVKATVILSGTSERHRITEEIWRVHPGGLVIVRHDRRTRTKLELTRVVGLLSVPTSVDRGSLGWKLVRALCPSVDDGRHPSVDDGRPRWLCSTPIAGRALQFPGTRYTAVEEREPGVFVVRGEFLDDSRMVSLS